MLNLGSILMVFLVTYKQVLTSCQPLGSHKHTCCSVCMVDLAHFLRPHRSSKSTRFLLFLLYWHPNYNDSDLANFNQKLSITHFYLLDCFDHSLQCCVQNPPCYHHLRFGLGLADFSQQPLVEFRQFQCFRAKVNPPLSGQLMTRLLASHFGRKY